MDSRDRIEMLKKAVDSLWIELDELDPVQADRRRSLLEEIEKLNRQWKALLDKGEGIAKIP
jgi:hypothetical protein